MNSEIFFTNLENFDKKDTLTGCTDGDTFGKALIRYMKEKKVTIDELSSGTGISVSTINRYRGDSVLPEIRNVVLISIYLRLHITRAEYLMKLSGCTFNGSYEHSLWHMLVGMVYGSSLTLEQCERFLSEHGYKTLKIDK